MKFASLKNGRRDGALVLVSSDLKKAVPAEGIAATLLEALEEWPKVQPQLKALSDKLNAGQALGAFDFEQCQLESPLPRTFQWCDGSAYLNHAELVRKARNAEMPEQLYHDPMLYQGASDSFIGPRDPILVAKSEWGIDLEGEVAIVTDDVPMGVSVEEASKHIKLVMILNDVSLRNIMPAELAKGFGFLVSKPSTAFSPVAITPEELGGAWDGGKVLLPLICHVNDSLLGKPDAGVDCYFDFPRLIAHAAQTRELRAGTIIGSGTVSNRDTSVGTACIQEKRMLEKLATGEMHTPHLQFGDRVRVEMLDADGQSVFGAIEQTVVQYQGPVKNP
ncbi:fumarylacetoacetate hydrolase family protein [Pseudomonas sp. ES3-33]|uniref:fumarylacetoacetate hydrolase family protein n=1 Tax=Pseudomonas sp. ES3-33 TaxID=1628833 RepID=UPI0005D4151E|nr:fumarylacetoacetate hydrolase family protein [Pseudomonas sp. ES3-33]KJH76734.1 2-keto-4-pentenoate hydratase [Pseudomonas sp. ES3-33]